MIRTKSTQTKSFGRRLLTILRKICISIVAFVLVLVLIVTGFIFSFAVRGYLNARNDVANGRYNIMFAGYPDYSKGSYRRLLDERYGIEGINSGCLITPMSSSYNYGYNLASKTAANKKYGRDIFKECSDAAQRSTRKM